jgi:hypothetical protein
LRILQDFAEVCRLGILMFFVFRDPDGSHNP